MELELSSREENSQMKTQFRLINQNKAVGNGMWMKPESNRWRRPATSSRILLLIRADVRIHVS